MKLTYPKILIATIATFVFAASAPLASAAKPHKMTAAQMEAMCKTMDPAECKMMMRAMLKRPELYPTIKAEMKGSSEYQKYYDSHPGSGG